MDRREFIKKSAIVAVVGAAAGAGIASPIASAIAKDSNNNAKIKDMKVLLINGSPRKEGNTHLALTEAALDTEGLQSMRTMADNMAWLLKKIHTGTPDYPEREPWKGMHFIR